MQMIRLPALMVSMYTYFYYDIFKFASRERFKVAHLSGEPEFGDSEFFVDLNESKKWPSWQFQGHQGFFHMGTSRWRDEGCPAGSSKHSGWPGWPGRVGSATAHPALSRVASRRGWPSRAAPPVSPTMP